MSEGWIKLHRKALDNSFCIGGTNKLGFWVYLLLHASHKNHSFMLGNTLIEIKQGQFLTGRKALSKQVGVSEGTIESWLNLLEKNLQQIVQQKTNKYRIITILNWNKYQMTEQQNDNRMTTEKQQNDTNKNDKNGKNDYIYANSPPAQEQLSIGEEYLQQKLENKSNVAHEFQVHALEIIEALNIPQNRKGAYFKAVKDFPRIKILEAYSFAVDHPTIEARDKMFFWKLNQKNENK